MSEMVQTDSAKIMQEAEPPILGPQAVIPYYEEYEGLRKFYASFRFQHDLKYFRILSLRQPRFSNARYQIEYLIDKLTVQIRPKNRSANGDLARNYGKYASSVEKMLRSFEGVEEWTDLISALTRLNKVLMSGSHYPVIPHRIQVSRCLANCLTKTYPAGVHKKVLEVYIDIFKSSSIPQTVEDLPLWTLGLFPFTEISGFAVKGLLLTIYRERLLNLGEFLIPCLKGVILSILPLFEGEEGGALAEGFNLLENLRAKTGNDAFHTSFWLSIVSSPQIRIPALGYIPKVCPSPSKSLDNTILDINGENLGLMVLSLRLMLNDNSVLVNRGALDILCKHFPMSDDILPRNETLSLLIIALQLFQTRDVSLTRRVKSWLQGDSQDQNQYLPNKALQLFIEAIKIIMESSNPNDSQSVLRPYKMLSEALNQIPVDPLSSPKLYTSILICHKNMCLQTRFRNAIGKQINNLFADVHPSIFWSCLNSLAVDCTPLNPDAREIADTLTFYFQNPTITHLSLRGPCSLFLKLCITSLKNSRRDDPLCMHIISLCKLVLCHLVSLDDSVSCPDEDTINTQKHKNKSDVGLESLNGSHHFYVYILDKLVSALYALMEVDSTKVESGSRCAKIISDPCAPSLVPLLDLIHTVIQLISKHIAKEPSEHTYMSKIKTLARTLANFLTDTTSFPVVLSLFKCIHSCILLLSSEKDFKFSDSEHSSIAKGVVKLTWKFFYKSHMVYASKASSIISMLCNIHNPTNIEHHILTMANACKVTDYYGTVEAMAIFISTLAASTPRTSIYFPRVCLLLIECLSCDDHELYLRAGYALSIYSKAHTAILDPLLHSILSKKILRVAETVEVNERKIKIYHYKSFGNAHYIRFSLRALSDCICKYGDTFLYAHFKSEYEMLSAFDDDPCGNHGGVEKGKYTYADIILYTALLFLYSQPSPGGDSGLDSNVNHEIHKVSLRVISSILIDRTFRRPVISLIDTLLSFRLLHCVSETSDLSLGMHILDVLSYLQSVSVYSEDNDDDTHGKKHEFETYQDFSNTLAFLRNHITESDTNVNAILGKAEFASYIVLECFEIFSKKEFPLCSAGVWIEYFSHFVPLTVSWPLDIHYRAAIIMKGILSSSNEKLESTLQHRYGSVLDPLGPDQGYNISNAVGDLSNFTRDLSLCIGDVHCIIKLLLKFSYVMKYGEPLGNQRQKEGSWISTAKLKAVRDSIFDFEYNIARYISSKTANFAPKYNSEQANAPPMKNHDIVSYGEYIKKLRTKFVNMEKFMKCILVEILTLHSLLTKYCEMHQRSVQQDYTTDLGNSAGKDSPRQLTPRDDDSNYSFAEDTYILECLTFMKNEVENILESLYTIEPAEFCICIFDAWRNSEVELHSGIFPLSLCCINSANICDSISPTNIQGPRSMKFLDSVKPHLRKSLINYSIATLKNSPNYLIQKSQPSQPPISSGKASLANIISFHYYLLKCSDSRDTLNTCTEFFSAIRTFLNKCKYFSQRDFPEGTAMIFYPMLVYVDALTTSDDTRNAKEIKEIEDVFVKAAEFCSGLILHSHGSYNLSSSIVKYDETDQAAYQKTLKPREPHYSLTLQRTNVSTDLEYVLKELDVLYDVIVHMNKANHGCIKLTNSLQIIFNLTAGTMLKSGAISNIHIYNKLLKIVREFIKVPKMQKIWKPVVMDKFFSSDFFHTDKSITPGWIHIVNALINDKLVIKDLVSRVNKAPTSNLFTSREQDTQIKACSIKRLAFCVLSGTQSVLYDHMPAIRDKLISLLKCREDALRPETYLLARVVMVKFKRSPFSLVWSIIFSELIELFARCITRGVEPSQINGLYAALKLVDQAVVLRLADFQWHQWVFFNESPKSEALSGDRFNHTVYRPLLARLKSKVELAFTETESASDIASKSLSRHTTLRTLSQTFDNGRLSFPSAKEYEKSIAAIIPRNLPTRYHLCNPSFARMSLRKPTISTIAELLESINALTSGFSKITYTADTPDMEDVVSSILSEFSNTDARSGSVRAF